ncbi:DUF1405 domain-containing protein [Cohnella nanjingensis]|uniref:DUF1405 domain-containing protein n=1 Tax=Cohnella nanjingensis TaxID=1387779 RepID=A0A7X0RXD5_9BACL|nr:DUF1405 domain-containing protein [Cohnella nanjingensis]MBB6674115.1 DUF1405 domain-containing protein [Cohnella nanjingensis]
MNLRAYLSRNILLHRTTMLLLMIFYIPGTIYGYYWYKDQLLDTWKWNPHWQIPFVPDSPTASLFFTIAALWLWIRPAPNRSALWGSIRSLIEALAVVTSVKYGVWASAIIFAGAAYGDQLVWEHWMLVASHLSMAVCAVLYARFFHFRAWALAAAAAWTFLNDTVDYGFGVYPYLPNELMDKLVPVAIFTFLLTALSVLIAGLSRFLPGALSRTERMAA